MSEQTEGPYHPAMNRLSVKFGPEHDQVKFSSPETVDTECALMNIAFNQSVSSQQAQQARIEELTKETWSLGTERDELKVHIRELEAELEARKKAWEEMDALTKENEGTEPKVDNLNALKIFCEFKLDKAEKDGDRAGFADITDIIHQIERIQGVRA